jgi:hypothetical protein
LRGGLFWKWKLKALLIRVTSINID